MLFRSFILTAGLALIISACQTLPVVSTARINLDDPATRSVVTLVLSKAVHRAHIELGPVTGDTAVVSVLPPSPGPYETHSMAVPVQFDIQKHGDVCLALRRDTHDAFALKGIACKP
ncbi:MAG: hypothetical protein WBQ60_03515 [Asticcacaulis sp.]